MIRDDRGFTLAEVLVAVAIMTVGLVGLAVVMPLAGYSLQQGNQHTTATFLAQQRLEQARNAAWTGALYPSPLPLGWIAPTDCLGTSAGNSAPTTTKCSVAPCVNGTSCTVLSDEGNAAIPGFSGYSRTTRVTDCSIAPGCGTAPFLVLDAKARLVRVDVTFNPMSGVGGATAGQTFTVSQDLFIAQR